MNVLLIIIDALRPDHLRINGYGRDTSPNIDQFSREATTFLNAYTVLPRTTPAIASLLTGLYPYSHGIRLVSNKVMKPSISTLAEILSNHGYATIFLGAGGLSKDGTERGYHYYDPLPWKIINKFKRGIYKITHPNGFMGGAQQHIGTAMRWIRHNPGKPFFLTIHFNDIHWPYPVPPPFDHMFDAQYTGNHDFNTLISDKYTRGEIVFGNVKLPEKEIEHAIAHYDGGIRYIDYHLGRFFDFLKERNIMDNTLIILTSDHGEHFGEHGYYFQHGASVYEQSIRSTLILHNAKIVPKGRKIEARVQTMDIMPTVLDILNVPLLESLETYSLSPLIKGEKENVRDFVFVESAEEHIKGNARVFFQGNKGKWRAMIVGDWKIIYIPHPEKEIFELYNLKDDPLEENDLVSSEVEKAVEMREKLMQFLKTQSNEGDADIGDLKEKSRRLLVKAGYLEE